MKLLFQLPSYEVGLFFYIIALSIAKKEPNNKNGIKQPDVVVLL
jgi:hypothetical protein